MSKDLHGGGACAKSQAHVRSPATTSFGHFRSTDAAENSESRKPYIPKVGCVTRRTEAYLAEQDAAQPSVKETAGGQAQGAATSASRLNKSYLARWMHGWMDGCMDKYMHA